jgi:hypothetical protein
VDIVEDESNRSSPREPDQQGPDRFKDGKPGRGLRRSPAEGGGDTGEDPRQLLLAPSGKLDQALARKSAEV